MQMMAAGVTRDLSASAEDEEALIRGAGAFQALQHNTRVDYTRVKALTIYLGQGLYFIWISFVEFLPKKTHHFYLFFNVVLLLLIKSQEKEEDGSLNGGSRRSTIPPCSC